MAQVADLADKKALKTDVIVGNIKVIDGYLLGIFMLIFSYGLYELFISKIDDALTSETSKNVLLIKSFDDLKTRCIFRSIGKNLVLGCDKILNFILSFK